MANIAYVVSTGSAARADSNHMSELRVPIGFGGQPAGVALLVNLDRIRSRSELVARLREIRAAIASDKPLG